MEYAIEKRAKIINDICFELKIKSDQIKQNGNFNDFDYGDTFFALCFKSDKELKKIAKLCLINID